LPPTRLQPLNQKGLFPRRWPALASLLNRLSRWFCSPGNSPTAGSCVRPSFRARRPAARQTIPPRISTLEKMAAEIDRLTRRPRGPESRPPLTGSPPASWPHIEACSPAPGAFQCALLPCWVAGNVPPNPASVIRAAPSFGPVRVANTWLGVVAAGAPVRNFRAASSPPSPCPSLVGPPVPQTRSFAFEERWPPAACPSRAKPTRPLADGLPTNSWKPNRSFRPSCASSLPPEHGFD